MVFFRVEKKNSRDWGPPRRPGRVSTARFQTMQPACMMKDLHFGSFNFRTCSFVWIRLFWCEYFENKVRRKNKIFFFFFFGIALGLAFCCLDFLTKRNTSMYTLVCLILTLDSTQNYPYNLLRLGHF